MMALFKAIRKLFTKRLKSVKILSNNWGYTLAEMTAVIGVTATLTALSIPIVVEKMDRAKQARTAQDITRLAQAVQNFFTSTGEWPTRNAAGTRNDIQLLTVGKGNDPRDNTGTWGRVTRRDDAFNHLVDDRPEGTDDVYTNARVEWDGPYVGDMKEDAWGNNYFIYVEPFYTPELPTEASRIFGWIISAGPNGTLETSTTSPTLNDNPVIREGRRAGARAVEEGDDIGMMLFKDRIETTGVQ